MSNFHRSIDILLDDAPPETHGRDFIMTPLSSGEAWVFDYGFAKRLKDYKEVKEQTDSTLKEVEEEILLGFFVFLVDKIDKYRLQAHGIANALSDKEPPHPREYQAIAIGKILLAQSAKKNGWPRRERNLEAAKQLKLQ